MRTDIADNLRQIQERLGSDLSGVLDSDSDPAAAFVSPSVDRGLSLVQISGLDAGGSFPLSVGSYRFGERPGPSSLAQGQPITPRFGLTVGPDGTVTVIPPPSGLVVNGELVAQPTIIGSGQIIDAGTARFVVKATASSLLRRVEESALALQMDVPVPAKSRGVDASMVEWAKQGHDLAVQASRNNRLGPAEINQRTLTGPSSFYVTGPGQPGFGRVAIAIGEVPYTVPGELSMVNAATHKKLEGFPDIPASSIELDLLSQSVAIVGPAAAARAVVAWIALCVTTLSRVDSVGVRLLARGNRNDWTWVDALPNAEHQPNSPLNLILVDEGTAPSDLPAKGAVVAIEPGQQVPDGATMVMELGATDATVTDRSTGAVTRGVSPIGVSAVFALGVTFQIAEHSHGGRADWGTP